MKVDNPNYRKYQVFWFSELGTQRGPAMRNILMSQRDKFIFDFRKVRQKSRTDINIIWFRDINRYACILPALPNGTTMGVTILDDDEFVKNLGIDTRGDSKHISTQFWATYEKYHMDYLLPIEEINKSREVIKETYPNHKYLKPLTLQQYTDGFDIEYITLPLKVITETEVNKNDSNK